MKIFATGKNTQHNQNLFIKTFTGHFKGNTVSSRFTVAAETNNIEHFKNCIYQLLQSKLLVTLEDWHEDKLSNILVDLARKLDIEVIHFTKLKEVL